MDKLGNLLKKEAEVQQQRKAKFFSEDFCMCNAGPLFPSSWKASMEIAHGKALGCLSICSDREADAACVLKSVAPLFEKSAEDGTGFRIYRQNGLEVRTIQEPDGEEVTGAVFSMDSEQAIDNDDLVKVTEYVENAQVPPTLCYNSYVVLEAKKGNLIMTEKLEDGTLCWEVNPASLHDRNASAKVIR